MRTATTRATIWLAVAILGLVFVTALAGTRSATSARAAGTPSVSLTPVASGLEQPVYLTAAPGDTTRLFVVEKTGKVRIIKNGALLPGAFLDLSAKVPGAGEQGLLSIAFDPGYAANGFVYVDYTDLRGDTRIVRHRVSGDPDVVAPASVRPLLKVDQPYRNHNGGQLQFGPDERLYVGMGDGGNHGDPGNRAQDPSTRLGKMLRINVRVSPPAVTTYARGLRNPWRFSFDRLTGDLWIGDVGQEDYEEIDFVEAGAPRGANFGWSAYEGDHVYKPKRAAKLGYWHAVWPVAEVPHPTAESIIGGYVYRGEAVPDLQGMYLFADFVTGRVWAKSHPYAPHAELPGATQQLMQITSVGEDAKGELYLLSIGGTVHKIVAAP